MQGSSRSAPPAAWRALLVCVFALAAHGLAAQAQAPAVGITPGLGDEGKAAFAEFRAAPTHKAFAIAPGGAWAWQANLPTREAALAAALEECAKSASQRCAPYMIDDGVVFDARAWPALWAPYPTAAQTAQAAIGNARGQRLYDLALTALAHELEEAVNLHLQDEFDGEKLVFDYRLRAGVVQKSNALALMRAAGLPLAYSEGRRATPPLAGLRPVAKAFGWSLWIT